MTKESVVGMIWDLGYDLYVEIKELADRPVLTFFRKIKLTVILEVFTFIQNYS